ncbi:MAG: ATP-binding protein, partial [Pseudomonadota bacterium]
ILPVSQLFGGQGEKAVTAPYLDGVAGEWTTALHQTPSGVLLSARCRQVPQGWVVSLLDDGSAREVGAMQEALDAAEADLQRFLYIAGHDLRAPLRALKTLPGWISEEIEASFGPPDADLAEYIEELEIQAERMDRLLLDVLTFSRIGRRGDPAREIDTEALLDEVRSGILPESFGLTVDGALPDLTAQPNEVMLLLQCLLSNVVKHHDRDRGRIKITTQRGCAGLTLKVEDDGPGIDPRFREKVFEMFSTLKPRDEVEGSGIGLAMVRKIVDLWGGSVVLEDSDLGGLCVRIDLPSPFEHTKAAA